MDPLLEPAYRARVARIERRQEREAALALRGRRAASALELVTMDEETLTSGTFDPLGFFVYQLFAYTYLTPFYVGQTTNLFLRLGQHYSQHGGRIARVQVIRCANRRIMCDLELDLIKLHEPELNITGVAARGKHRTA